MSMFFISMQFASIKQVFKLCQLGHIEILLPPVRHKPMMITIMRPTKMETMTIHSLHLPITFLLQELQESSLLA
jgi:hypothetical protein